MKVAVASQGPYVTSEVDPQFGRAKFLIVLDTDTGRFTVHDNRHNLSADRNAGSRAARTVVRLGADTVITGNVGTEALATLEAGNIKVCIGAGGSVKDAVERFKAGQVGDGNELHDEKYYWT